MKKTVIDTSKRQLLVGAGVATATAVWHQPAIKAVVLPAHAQMSMAAPSFFAAAVVSDVTQRLDIKSMFIADAHAGLAESSKRYEIAIAPVDGDEGMYDVGVFEEFVFGGDSGVDTAQVVYRGQTALGAETVLETEQNPCPVKLLPFIVKVVQDNGDSIDIDLLTANLLGVNVPQSDGVLSTAECVRSVADTYFDDSVQGVFASQHNAKHESLLERLVSPAYAQAGLQGLALSRVPGLASSFDIVHRDQNQQILRTGVISIFGGSEILSVDTDACGFDELPTIRASIVSIDLDEVVVLLDFPGECPYEFTVPAASIGDLPVSCGVEN